ncbi:MAG: FHA domain-containing protein [Anaerolineales bacterium]
MPNHPTLDKLFELLGEFTYLRQVGHNRDDAWYTVMDRYPDLSDSQVKTLLRMAKDWEKREGHKYRYGDTTSTQQIEKLAEKSTGSVIKPLTPRQPQDQVTGTLDANSLRKEDQQRLADILEQSEGLDQLPQTHGTQQLQPIGDADIDERAYFGPELRLLLYFKKRPRQPFALSIRPEQEIIVGRNTTNAAMAPDIDLSDLDGERLGVSRMHAAMKREGTKLLITDLGSVNHTMLNGQRLFPDEIRTVCYDDEIWFGRLMCRVRFER